MKKNNYLITGSSSGLGKYLREQLGGTAYQRTGTNVSETDTIIHCAVNRARDVTSQNLYQYLSDNVFLTKKVTQIPHKKCIYISSVDVYPKTSKQHNEKEEIHLDTISNFYAATKLMSEAIIQKLCPKYLILRCSALLGKDAKANSLTKIINEEQPRLTLSADSVFNYVLHNDVLEFINLANKNNLQGIYNLTTAENITLAEIAKLLDKKVTFGEYTYNVGDIDNTKASKLLPSLQKTSREVIRKFIFPSLSKRG